MTVHPTLVPMVELVRTVSMYSHAIVHWDGKGPHVKTKICVKIQILARIMVIWTRLM